MENTTPENLAEAWGFTSTEEKNFTKRLYGSDGQDVKVIRQGDKFIFEGTFDSVMFHGRAEFSKEELIDFLELND